MLSRDFYKKYKIEEYFEVGKFWNKVNLKKNFGFYLGLGSFEKMLF